MVCNMMKTCQSPYVFNLHALAQDNTYPETHSEQSHHEHVYANTQASQKLWLMLQLV